MAGRRPLNGQRMKPNGLSAELDNWYTAEAHRRGLTAMALKRQVLENWRIATVKIPLENRNGPDISFDVPYTLVSGE